MGDKIAVLNMGRIVQVGTPNEIYNRPANTFVAGFVGSPTMNLLAGEMGDGSLATGAGRLPMATRAAGTAARKIVVGIRSEDVRVGGEETSRATVHDVENHGVEKIVTLRVNDQLFKATVPATVALGVDEVVPFAFDPAKLHCFDAATGQRLEL